MSLWLAACPYTRPALLCHLVQTWTCHLLWPIEWDSSFEPSGPTTTMCFGLKHGRAGRRVPPKHTFWSFLKQERHWPATAACPSPPSGRTLKGASNGTCSGPAHSKHQGRVFNSFPKWTGQHPRGAAHAEGLVHPKALRGSLPQPCAPVCPRVPVLQREAGLSPLFGGSSRSRT